MSFEGQREAGNQVSEKWMVTRAVHMRVRASREGPVRKRRRRGGESGEEEKNYKKKEERTRQIRREWVLTGPAIDMSDSVGEVVGAVLWVPREAGRGTQSEGGSDTLRIRSRSMSCE